MKKLIVAKTAGFCMGVKRAVDMTMQLIEKEKGNIYTYGPLIHNPQVTELLKGKGVIILKDDMLPSGGSVIIRAHGVTPSVHKTLEEGADKIINATCPYVVKVQQIIARYSMKGYSICIIGDKGHAEVESYLGYSNKKGIVISNVSEVDGANLGGKVCIVVQTTLNRDKYEKIVKKIKEKGLELKIFDTICSATSQRQKEALEISKLANLMIVVGGRNSANSKRLEEICKSTGTPTFFIERAEELDLSEVDKYNIVGLTAGASTSKETIQDVIYYIGQSNEKNIKKKKIK